jgi:hypothetical protein
MRPVERSRLGLLTLSVDMLNGSPSRVVSILLHLLLSPLHRPVHHSKMPNL